MNIETLQLNLLKHVDFVSNDIKTIIDGYNYTKNMLETKELIYYNLGILSVLKTALPDLKNTELLISTLRSLLCENVN